MYYTSFRNDRRITQAVVFGLFLIETIQTVLVVHDLFAIFAFGWGDEAQLQVKHFEPLTIPITSGIGKYFPRLLFVGWITISINFSVGLVVQGCYAHHISSFSSSEALTFVVVMVRWPYLIN